ncbi:histidine kinase [Streptomyces sp. BH106]|uniref:GAF domain-containing sensor histidine kinase n=1 Tax=Streptomyces sp. BH106 TaxID=3410409 RepID=UPI003CE69F6D
MTISEPWVAVLDTLAHGVALLGCDDRRIRWINHSAEAILRAPRDTLAGRTTPFAPLGGDSRTDTERHATWWVRDGEPIELAYSVGEPLELASGAVVPVEFRDVTEQRHQHRRVAALARTAASTASDSSLTVVLNAMAGEVQRSHGVAGTQVVIVPPDGEELQVMGSAGFSEVSTFFDLLMASRDRGADLITYRCLRERRQFVLPGRRAQMIANPAWQPLHDYVAQLDWDDFISTPLLSRGKALGALNVYVATGHRATAGMLAFLESIAEQAALAVDYATLISKERLTARSEERERLARNLHDSVVQHVFSLGMQARGLAGIGRRLPEPYDDRVQSISDEMTDLVDKVQRDLRGVVLALQPSVAAQLGLATALERLARDVERRDGVRAELVLDPKAETELDGTELAEDVYQIVAEAVHNAVKHARPTRVRAALAIERGVLRVEVCDDGIGLASHRSGTGGFGLTSMRDRARRWSGSVEIDTEVGSGTNVRAELRLPADRRIERGDGT